MTKSNFFSRFLSFFVLTAALALSACSRTPSNVHVLSTTDCGATWTKLTVGSMVPSHTGSPCGYNTALPNWDMAGEVKFKTQFDKKVLSNATLSYTYSITDPLAFIKEARYLGKMGGSLEISADTVGDRYEMAENIIIDKLLREETTNLTRKIDVVDANPSDIEEAVFKAASDLLQKRGVTLSDVALVIVNEDQTRLAIDIATALRVYEAASVGEVGQKIMAARAGATQININPESKQ